MGHIAAMTLAKEALRRLLSEKQAAPHVGLDSTSELLAPRGSRNPGVASGVASSISHALSSGRGLRPITISGMQLRNWQQAKPPKPAAPVGVGGAPVDLDPPPTKPLKPAAPKLPSRPATQ